MGRAPQERAATQARTPTGKGTRDGRDEPNGRRRKEDQAPDTGPPSRQGGPSTETKGPPGTPIEARIAGACQRGAMHVQAERRKTAGREPVHQRVGTQRPRAVGAFKTPRPEDRPSRGDIICGEESGIVFFQEIARARRAL